MEARVSCRAVADLLAVCDERGVDLTGLTEGLDVTEDTLRTRSEWVAWAELVVIVERLAERVGGPQAYAELVGSFVDHPKARLTRRFFSIASTPERNYSLIFRWAGPLVYPFLKSKVETTDDGIVHIVHEIPKALPGSLPFMLSAVEMARRLPRIHGLPDAVVEADVDPWRASMAVRLPVTVSWVGRVRQWLRFVRDAPTFIAELIEQQQRLHQGQAVLEEALGVARARERELSAEVEARKRAQEELAARNDLLLHSQRMESIGRLAGGVAHDFNNLLTAILGHASYLQDVSSNDEVQQGLSEIQGASERAAALTRQLLTFARQQRTRQDVHELNGLLRGVQGLLARVMQGHSLRIEASDVLLHVRCDPVQLEQVLVNLAVNAADAMPNGGTVTIDVLQVEVDGTPHARLRVTDTGVGMPKEVADHVFEPFFTTKGDLGTGLGLATAYGIVAEAGGEIRLQSEVGVGTCFVIDWPLDAAPEASPEMPAVPDLPSSTARVLVLEDEPAIAMLIVRALEAKGHTVHTAEGHEAAHAIVGAHPIDLVISDVMLAAGERGPDIVASLPDADTRKVLFISGYADPERLSDLGQAPFLAKPFRMSVLAKEVDRLLATA